MNIKRSVALVIRDYARPGMLLLVQRPDDDEDLPGFCGLPAASLREGESRDDAARRAGRDKLGVELDVGRVINAGTKQRASYTLDMHLMEARIAGGSLRTDGPVPPGTTRYQGWHWGAVEELTPAAAGGSLCSRLALEVLAGVRAGGLRDVGEAGEA